VSCECIRHRLPAHTKSWWLHPSKRRAQPRGFTEMKQREKTMKIELLSQIMTRLVLSDPVDKRSTS
jgi:hypothetical protein